MTITRAHHPLHGRAFEVLKGGGEQIVIRLEDGTSMRVPRRWTDADGSPLAPRTRQASVFTFDSLRRLLALLDAFSSRE